MIDQNDLHRRMLNGALTNYLRAAVRLLKTVFLTRILFFNLGADYYGFWALLWAIFGYILLFELGFGKTVQKYAAEAAAGGDFRAFNTIAQAVFTSYLAIALIIAVATGAAAWYLPGFIALPPGDPEYYQWTFLAFGLGCAVVFPTGIIPEILVGLQRLHYRNWVIMGNQIFELVGIGVIFKLGGSLLAVALFVAANNLISNFIMYYWVRRLLPQLTLRPTRLTWSVLRGIANFSGFVYMMAMAKLILLKTDPLVLGAMLGLGAVAVYQLGTRLPELVKTGAGQFQETLGPTAAMYYRNGQLEELRKLMFSSQRLSNVLGFGALALTLPLAAVTLKIWLHIDSAAVHAITVLMLINAGCFVLLRDTGREFLLMAGHHRLLAYVAVGECVVNLGLSIALVKLIGVTGVAHGTLWPNVAIALFIMAPATIRLGGFKLGTFAKLYLVPLACALPVAAGLGYLTMRIGLERWNFGGLLLAATGGGIVYLGLAAGFCVNASERRALLNRVLKK